MRHVPADRASRQPPLPQQIAVKGTQLRIDCSPEAPVFPNRAGRPLTRSGVEQRLRAAVARPSARCPFLAGRRISPHTLRHTTAMHLLSPASTSPSSRSGSTRGHRDDPRLHRGRPRDEGGRAAAPRPTVTQDRALHGPRPAARLPRGPLTMRIPSPSDRPWARSRPADSAESGTRHGLDHVELQIVEASPRAGPHGRRRQPGCLPGPPVVRSAADQPPGARPRGGGATLAGLARSARTLGHRHCWYA
ncbi:MAG: hypothetical protein QOK40_2436 [Miltoncostaeaceae bacterium]|nr:hypothetical protein [Miltoncostaeaceae bacterium]